MVVRGWPAVHLAALCQMVEHVPAPYLADMFSKLPRVARDVRTRTPE